MRDLLEDYDRLAAAGRPIGRAVVTSVWGSAPRAEGASMLADAEGTMAGSVSGGCVESATAEEIGAAIRRGTPKLVTFGVSHERAWEVGLACGGTIKVFVEPTVRPEVLAAARGSGGEVVATVVEGPGTGRSVRVDEQGGITGALGDEIPEDPVRDAALAALAREAAATISVETPGGPSAVFLEVFPRAPRLVIFGGVHIAVALVPLAKALGYRAIVADGRAGFLTRERFPDADELILAWPEEAFGRIGLDASCYVCILSHDPKFDEPALLLALRSPASRLATCR
jgi:xanthine dehydrogenase accessory factor